jgi:hypothetical protein
MTDRIAHDAEAFRPQSKETPEDVEEKEDEEQVTESGDEYVTSADAVDEEVDGERGRSTKDQARPGTEADAVAWDFTKDEYNPYNWPAWKKASQVIMTSSIAFTAWVSIPLRPPHVRLNTNISHRQVSRHFHHISLAHRTDDGVLGDFDAGAPPIVAVRVRPRSGACHRWAPIRDHRPISCICRQHPPGCLVYDGSWAHAFICGRLHIALPSRILPCSQSGRVLGGDQ